MSGNGNVYIPGDDNSGDDFFIPGKQQKPQQTHSVEQKTPPPIEQPVKQQQTVPVQEAKPAETKADIKKDKPKTDDLFIHDEIKVKVKKTNIPKDFPPIMYNQSPI